jgi:hypothetical protein
LYRRKQSGIIGLNLIHSKTIIARDQAGDESFRVIQASLGLGEFRTGGHLVRGQNTPEGAGGFAIGPLSSV